MVSFTSLFACLSIAASALAAPLPGSDLITFGEKGLSHLWFKRTTPNSTGTIGSMFYSFWSDGTAQATYTNVAAGEYRVTWTGNVGNFVGGQGWSVGAARSINFSGSWSCSGNCYLSVYGWTTSPLVEYYILENFGTFNPGSQGTLVGTVTSDGSVYNIYTATRTNAPSIQGTQTFKQYWSIRQSKRTSGTVTTANHFNAWKSHGMTLGTFNYQIVRRLMFRSEQ